MIFPVLCPRLQERGSTWMCRWLWHDISSSGRSCGDHIHKPRGQQKRDDHYKWYALVITHSFRSYLMLGNDPINGISNRIGTYRPKDNGNCCQYDTEDRRKRYSSAGWNAVLKKFRCFCFLVDLYCWFAHTSHLHYITCRYRGVSTFSSGNWENIFPGGGIISTQQISMSTPYLPEYRYRDKDQNCLLNCREERWDTRNVAPFQPGVCWGDFTQCCIMAKSKALALSSRSGSQVSLPWARAMCRCFWSAGNFTVLFSIKRCPGLPSHYLFFLCCGKCLPWDPSEASLKISLHRPDRASKSCLLWNNADSGAEIISGVINILTIQQNSSFVGIIESGDQIYQSGFSKLPVPATR